MKKLPEYFFLFIIITFVLLGSGIKGYAEESLIAYNDYTLEDTPRTQETERKVVITTNWKGYMPVDNSRAHNITVPTLQIRQGEILSLEFVCPQQKSSYAANMSSTPKWSINTELNYDPASYWCDVLIIGPSFLTCDPPVAIGTGNGLVKYAAIFLFRSIGKTGHFEFKYTVNLLARHTHWYASESGNLVIHVPVDILPLSPET